MCKYCQKELNQDDLSDFNRKKNSFNITDGRWNSIRAGINREGHFIMYADGQSDGQTDDFVPEWCPFCGRHLYEINNNGERIFL